MISLWHFAAGFIAWMPTWLRATLVFALIFAAGTALQAIVLRVVSAQSKKWNPLVRLMFLRARRVVRFALLILAIAIALPLVPMSHAAEDSWHRALVASLILLIGWIVLIVTGIAIERYIGRLRIDDADNLLARKAVTQMRVVSQAINILIVMLTIGFALMSFDSVRQFGVSLFASAGVAGIVAGLAARPMLENMFSGLQLAITQPLRLGDAVVINNEWGSVEEITSTYVVMRLWDWRRQIVPLSYLFQNPFTNWTRSSAAIIGAVLLYVDYTAPVERIRSKAEQLIRASKLWDGKVVNLQVSDAREHTIELRVLMSAADSSKAWDLRCEIREKLISYIQQEFPDALPLSRTELLYAPALPQPGNGEAVHRRDRSPSPSSVRT
jgi:small-conductance mechanosensitive channel